MQFTRALCAGLLWSGAAGAASAQVAPTPIQQLAGTWDGTVGTSRTARIRFTFPNDSTRVAGSFDALGSGVFAWPVRVAADTGETFRIILPNGWVFRARLAGAEMTGMLAAGGKSAPISLRRAERAAPPYAEEAVVFKNGDVTLSGTLLLPHGSARVPAVVFAHGSGEVDRTADAFLGDHLARNGVAVLLYDKRGVGKSTGEWRRTNLVDLADDAVAGVRLLRSRSGIDSTRVGIGGRSQGGQLAIIGASRYPEVAFAIDIAGSVIPPWQQMNYEVAAQMTRDGFSRDDSVSAQAIMNEKWTVARTANGWDSLAAHVARVRAAKPAWLRYVQLPDKLSDIRDSWDGQMGFDYGPVLAKLNKPVLALFGERDTSTPTDATAAALRAAFSASRNTRATIHVYPNADHSLLVWQDHPTEMVFPTYPPGYPEIVARWIRELAQTTRTPEAELRAVDSAWARNYAAHDTATALQLMADDFFMTSSNGTTKDRAAEMRDIRATPGLRMNYFRTSQVRVSMHATSAVVTGLAEWAFEMNGRSSTSSREYIAVYRRGGPLGWQLAVLNMRLVGAGTSGQAEIRAAADSLMRTMVAAFKREPASVARYYTDDARIVGGGTSAVGRQQVDAYWAQATGFADWTLEVLAAGGEPNSPWVIGRSMLKSQSGREMLTEFVGVLRRGADGQLRFYIDRFAAAR